MKTILDVIFVVWAIFVTLILFCLLNEIDRLEHAPARRPTTFDSSTR